MDEKKDLPVPIPTPPQQGSAYLPNPLPEIMPNAINGSELYLAAILYELRCLRHDVQQKPPTAIPIDPIVSPPIQLPPPTEELPPPTEELPLKAPEGEEGEVDVQEPEPLKGRRKKK